MMIASILLLLLSAAGTLQARDADDRPRLYPWRVESPKKGPVVVAQANPRESCGKVYTIKGVKGVSRTTEACDGTSSASAVTIMTIVGPPVSQPAPVATPHANSTASLKHSVSTSTTSTNATAGSTASSTASSTVASVPSPILCNGHAEFCSRRYSNVTMIGAHNSPFVLSKNLAANQDFHVTQQLDDGIRFVQGQMHWPKNSTIPHFCHTSCNLLDAGPITSWLGEVRQWIDSHPHDVVTILLGNGDYSPPEKYAPFLEQSGLIKYAYIPPHRRRMRLNEWPTLGEMIRTNKRVVMMLDYKANQTAYPWLLNEFTYLWETPFDPTIPYSLKASAADTEDTFDSPFLTCAVQRPPDLPIGAARRGMYLMNHNLNVEISLMGTRVSVPALSLANQTNAATGNRSLGASAKACRDEWGHPPLVLNVDYYNHGTPPGSVFHVAAELNGVVYNGTCCGLTAGPISGGFRRDASMSLVVMGVMLTLTWLMW